AESTRLALNHGEGAVLVSYLEPNANGAIKNGKEAWQEQLYSTLYACPHCKISFEELEPRTFSFNSPYGACPACEGLGSRLQFDPELVMPDERLSMADGVAAWKVLSTGEARKVKAAIEPLLASHAIEWTTPLADMKPKTREELWFGNGKQFLGLHTLLEQQYVTAVDTEKREKLEALRGRVTCKACGGARLRAEARACRFHGLAIQEVTALSVKRARAWFRELAIAEHDQLIARPVLREIEGRLAFLEKVGVDYLTLDRAADTLSGGELQRVRLATGIGSGLVGVCYVLDEPSIGLHQRDNQRLIDALRNLQELGNTVLVVEHDEAMMRSSDWLVDMGPGAGSEGGRIVAQGAPATVMAAQDSITAGYLSGRLAIEVPAQRRKTSKTRSLVIESVTTNNLKDVDARVPLSALVCVTGVSGSGKSSLVNETLAKALAQRLGASRGKAGPHRSLRGASQVDKLIEIDQSPIGRTPRSNPATYCGVFDEVRRVFAGTREARQRGYKAGRFSFNVKGGRCEECQGQGIRRIEMNFLPDLTVVCPVCEGARFNRQTLEVRYRGLSIAEVLDMRIVDAVDFFQNFPQISRLLSPLNEVGLGYLSLGQSSTTLSGGEAQRVKLAAELARVDTGNTLYILDEPTTGLHFDDIRKLLGVLGRLVDLGNTVLVIEHNLDVIKSADWIIDLGPEGGEAGGYVIATGTPEEVAALSGNATGEFLKPLLERASGGE
ncbi:MAG TPA: excinuclease ABC subunit UvrA, partial [Pirellulales bacterium]|nr:excinuclease ABC subunit UvrA [Pirellulales bacterium]